MTTPNPHRHYYDYGYSEWQCVECNNATDYCEHDSVKVNNEVGCRLANRWPIGLPGDHPAFKQRENAAHMLSDTETD